KEFSFKQIVSEARKLAHFFQEKGLNKGDRVACMLPNSPQSVITYYGALMAGGVVVQVNPLFTERELTHMVEDRSEEHTSELQSRFDLVCRLLLEKKKNKIG